MKRIIIVLSIILANAACAYQAPVVVPNGTGAQVRTNLNNALQAVTTAQSGASAPATTYPYMSWVDTSTSPPTLRTRNSINNAWIAIGTLNDTGNIFFATNASSTGGLTVATGRNNVANQIVRTNASGYIDVGYINMTADVTANVPSHIAVQTGSDNYLRWKTMGAGSGIDADKLDGKTWVDVIHDHIAHPGTGTVSIPMYVGSGHHFYRFSVFGGSGAGSTAFYQNYMPSNSYAVIIQEPDGHDFLQIYTTVTQDVQYWVQVWQ